MSKKNKSFTSLCSNALPDFMRPISLRGLRAAQYGSALAMRRSIPLLEKVMPSLGRKLRNWDWIWQPVFSEHYFDEFYNKTVDPFDFDGKPYESDKYAHTMRLLNGQVYEDALEIGAAEGAFTQLLAPICISLLGVEVAEVAVERAKERLSGFDNVTFIQAALPSQMPEGRFDLIVASDVLYYFPKDVLLKVLARLEEGLKPGGLLFALHYLGDFSQAMFGGEVHDLMKAHLSLKVIHNETVNGIGPKGAGYTITIFKKSGVAA